MSLNYLLLNVNIINVNYFNRSLCKKVENYSIAQVKPY